MQYLTNLNKCFIAKVFTKHAHSFTQHTALDSAGSLKGCYFSFISLNLTICFCPVPPPESRHTTKSAWTGLTGRWCILFPRSGCWEGVSRNIPWKEVLAAPPSAASLASLLFSGLVITTTPPWPAGANITT